MNRRVLLDIIRSATVQSRSRSCWTWPVDSASATNRQLFSTMSWMDSWSRPNKSSATPPPLYLTDPDTKYCTSCGRMISDRKSHHKSNSKSKNSGDAKEQVNVVKYCSDGCRKRRVNPLDKRIDRTILALLQGQSGSGIDKIDVKSRTKKGDHRNLIATDEIEDIVFERSKQSTDADKSEGAEEDKHDSEAESDPYEVQDEAAMDSQGNRPNPTGPGSTEKRQEGQKRADEREAVRRAARRAVVFGFVTDEKETSSKGQSSDETPRRKCEAVMGGQVVEPSYAKGNWYIRWRE